MLAASPLSSRRMGSFGLRGSELGVSKKFGTLYTAVAQAQEERRLAAWFHRSEVLRVHSGSLVHDYTRP